MEFCGIRKKTIIEPLMRMKPNPRGTTFCGASRDLLLLALLILIVKLTTLAFRNPRGTTFCGASRDLLLLALSILIVKLTTLAFRNPRGTTFCGASRDLLLLALSILKKKRNSLFLRIPLLSHRAPDRTRTYTSLNTRS